MYHNPPEQDPRLILLSCTASAFGLIDFRDTRAWGVLPAFPFATDRAIAYLTFSVPQRHGHSPALSVETALPPAGLMLYTRGQQNAEPRPGGEGLQLTELLPTNPSAYALHACRNVGQAVCNLVHNQPLGDTVELGLGITQVNGTPQSHLCLLGLEPRDAVKALIYLGFARMTID